MKSWEGVNELVAVYETGSFTAASNRLDISVAQVSRQVSALENRLAIKLFYRTTRKVTPTEAGHLYYQHLRQVLDSLDEAERVLTQMQSSPRGTLKITAPTTFGESRIAPLLNDFLRLYPDLHLNCLFTNKKQDLINDGYDLAIRLGKLQDSSLMARRLASRQQYVCASPDYLERFGEPHILSELEHHQCLQGTLEYWRFQENGQERNIRIHGNIAYNSGQALTDAALKGLGLVQLPDFYVQPHLDSGRLVAVLQPFLQRDEGIWAVYPQNRHLSPKVRLLVDFLAATLSAETPDDTTSPLQ